MKYLKTYNESIDPHRVTSISDILFNLRILHNDSYPGIDSDVLVDDELWYKISDGELIKHLDDIDLKSITEEEEDDLIKIYHDAVNQFDINSLPSFDDINDALTPLYDIGTENGIDNVDIATVVFNFNKNHCIVEISPIQKLRMKDSMSKQDFDLELYTSISEEIIIFKDRLEEKYNIKHFINTDYKLNNFAISYEITIK